MLLLISRELCEAVKDSVANSEEIKYAILMDSSGKAVVHTQKPELVQTELTTSA